jgi:anti-sigma regulatory factor (Ser/Thr protein kinase)
MAREIITLSFPSRLELLGMLDKMLEGFVEQMECDEETATAVTISSIEAATNAIQHGHRRDSTKLVGMEFVVDDDQLEVRVRDSGPGFDPSSLEDCTDPANLLRARGRGIHIMRSLMDEVIFEFQNGHGTLVRLRKRLPPHNGTPR